jgi:hypothetical protein
MQYTTLTKPRNPALTALADGRDHIKTEEFARLLSKEPQTIRKNYSLKGECFGIRPRKVGSHLLWPVGEIAALLGEEAL